MADLALKITADTAAASAAFKDLAASSENLGAKIGKFAEKFNAESVDRFIERQNLAGIAMQATGRETEGLAARVSAYQREIERLIKAGLDPEDDSVKKLQGELVSLVQRQEEAAAKAEAHAAKEQEITKAFEDAAKAAAHEADVMTEILTAKSEAEAANIRLKDSQDQVKESIRALLNEGYSPESDEVKNLQAEYHRLSGEMEKNGEASASLDAGLQNLSNAMSLAGSAISGITGIFTGAYDALNSFVTGTAEAGDAAAKTARVIGTSAETWQELEYAASMSGVSSSSLQGSMQKLNKTMGDLKSGTGALAKYLGENDQALLANLRSSGNTEEAFMLLMDAIDRAPDEFTRAQLAQEAFGRSGQELIKLAEAGTGGIEALREEARLYGVISNESALASEEFLDSQARVQKAIEGVKNELAAEFMPVLTRILNGFADFIGRIDNWGEKLNILLPVIAGVAAAILSFMVISKVIVLVQALSAAMAALGASMTATGIGAIVVAIGLLVAALIFLVKNWDVVQTYLQQGIARLEYAFRWLGSQIAEKFIVAVNSIKMAFLGLLDIIQSKVLGGVQKLLEVMSHIPFVGESFRQASAAVAEFSGNISASIAETRAASQAAVDAAREEGRAARDAMGEKLAAIDEEARARRAALGQRQAAAEQEFAAEQAAAAEQEQAVTAAATAAQNDRNAAVAETALAGLRERLDLISRTEAQAETERQSQFTQFLQARLDAEKLSGAARVEYLREQADLVLAELDAQYAKDQEKYAGNAEALAALQAQYEENRQSAARASEDMITQIMAEAARKRLEDTAAGFQQMLSIVDSLAQASLDLQQAALDEKLEAFRTDAEARLATLKAAHEAELEDEALTDEEKKALMERQKAEEVALKEEQAKEEAAIIDAANKKARAAAVAQRVVANAEAVIQTYLAASKALAQGGGIPWGLPGMIATIAAGLANAVKINTTPIPSLSAETGGSYMIPQTGRVDDTLMAFNGGERVDVTPAGMAGQGGTQTFNLMFDGQVLASAINRLARAGELHTLQLAGNL